MQLSLQEICFPNLMCYGCGPANPDGLHIRSYWSDDGRYVIASFQPAPKFTSGLRGAVYGGMVASLMDCHSNWTAIAFGYRAEGRQPGTLPRIASVTASLTVRFLKPTPMGELLHLRAWAEGEVGRKTRVICELSAADTVTAIGDSLFVRVDPAQFEAAHGA